MLAIWSALRLRAASPSPAAARPRAPDEGGNPEVLSGSPMHDVLMSEMPKLGIKRHSERPSKDAQGRRPGHIPPSPPRAARAARGSSPPRLSPRSRPHHQAARGTRVPEDTGAIRRDYDRDHGFVNRRLERLLYPSTGAINAYQCPSVPSVATRNGPHRWLRAAHISCGHYQWASPVISGGHQRPSEAISGHQSPSAHHP